MGFLITDIFEGLYVICRKNRYNLFPIFLGLAVSAFWMPHSTLQGDFAIKWKFDLAFSWVVRSYSGWLSGRRRAAIYAHLCMVPVGIMSIILDSRLVAGACIAVGVVLLAQALVNRRQKNLLLWYWR